MFSLYFLPLTLTSFIVVLGVLLLLFMLTSNLFDAFLYTSLNCSSPSYFCFPMGDSRVFLIYLLCVKYRYYTQKDTCPTERNSQTVHLLLLLILRLNGFRTWYLHLLTKLNFCQGKLLSRSLSITRRIFQEGGYYPGLDRVRKSE